MQKSNFNLISLVVIVVLLVLLTAALFPAVSASHRSGNMSSVAARGRDIYVAITAANMDREPLGLPPVWPKSNSPCTNATDISQMNFTNSTDYFWALYDGDHLGTTNHNPYVMGFDFSKLAGAGVAVHSGNGHLNPRNNMWTIAKNVRDEMEDIIPILMTRNLAAESLASDVTDAALFNRRLYFNQQWTTPFGEKGVVMIRKGGGTFNCHPRYLTYRALYNSQTFRTTISDSQAPRLSYLTPNQEVTLSDVVHRTCATSGANPLKGYWYYWIKDVFNMVCMILPYFLIIGLLAGVFIGVFVNNDKQSIAQLSVMRPVYWLLLWLSVTTYICGFLIIYMGGDATPVVFSLALAVVFQVCSYLYLVAWKRRTGNLDAYQKAFPLILKAPLIALPGLIIILVVFPQ
jgi:type II secretory pathway pseudopilin PulG